MKALNKRKFKTEKEAKKHLADKYGVKPSQIEVIKPNKNRWMLRIADKIAGPKKGKAKPTAGKSYRQVLADYRAQNPEVPYADQQSAASAIFQAQKAA